MLSVTSYKRVRSRQTQAATAGSSSRQTHRRQEVGGWTRGQLVNTLGAGPRALYLEDRRWKSHQERERGGAKKAEKAKH